jgi:hypothetical protein
MADAMREKYAKLQKPVDEKAASDESLTLYFASATFDEHWYLYKVLMKFLLLECGLLAALVMLLSVGYENFNRTSHVVYATKTGRELIYHKLLAALSAGLLSFAVLTGLTLAVYLAFNDYGDIWGSSVSSGFNYINDLIAGARPFATWQSYTVLTYLIAVLGISAALILCFALMAFVIGAWMRNSYYAFMVFLIANGACVALAIAFAPSLLQYCTMLSPVWLWLKVNQWFTDGEVDILWKNFETLGVFVSLIALAGLCAFSAVMFKKREIV